MPSHFPLHKIPQDTARRPPLPPLQRWWAAFRGVVEDYLAVTMELDSATSEALKAMADTINEEVESSKRKSSKDQLRGKINNIPPCILSCLFDRFLIQGCAYNNYFCFCSRMTSTLRQHTVQNCMKKCPYNEERIYAKGTIVEFCDLYGDEDMELDFPQFLIEHEVNKRAFTSSGGAPPPGTVYVTETSTAPWGVAPYTITQAISGGTITVVDYVEDTDVLTTFFKTTTIPSGQAPYVSVFTDPKSAAITEVIGVHTVSKSTGSSSPTPYPSSSGGLSSSAKIGIGVAIPLIFIALAAVGILFFLRRRKTNREPQFGAPETHDGGLPEPTSTIAILEEPKDHPPSYHGLHVEAGGAPISEMNQDQQPEPTSHELNAAQQRYATTGSHVPASQELSADQARYEASGNPVYAGHELSTQPMSPSTTPASPVSSPARKPVPLPTSVAGAPSSSFPPPWDSTGAAEYERDLSIGPAEAAAAEDQELKELEEEVARVKMQKQRLQELQALETREEELRRSIAERKKMARKP